MHKNNKYVYIYTIIWENLKKITLNIILKINNYDNNYIYLNKRINALCQILYNEFYRISGNCKLCSAKLQALENNFLEKKIN